jgi:hypothetical protein
MLTVATMVTVVDAAFDGSAAGVAVIVIRFGDGAAAGAVYVAKEPGLTTAIVPQADPAQPVPKMLHEIAEEGLELGMGIKVATKLEFAPVLMAEGLLTENAKRLVSVIGAVAILDGSAALVAITMTAGEDGRICGAVNSPFALIVPHAGPAQLFPVMLQLTAVLGWPAEDTVATNVCWAPSSTEVTAGERATPRSLAIIIVAAAVFVGSATLVAWTVSTAGVGRDGGAVKIPFTETVPTVALPPGMPATFQVTAVFVAFETIAVKVAVSPSRTDVLLATIVTEIAGGAAVPEPELGEVTPHPLAIPDKVMRQIVSSVIRRERAARIPASLRALRGWPPAMTCQEARCMPADQKLLFA